MFIYIISLDKSLCYFCNIWLVSLLSIFLIFLFKRGVSRVCAPVNCKPLKKFKKTFFFLGLGLVWCIITGKIMATPQNAELVILHKP